MPDTDRPGEAAMTAVDLAQAVRRAAATIATDPALRHYSPDTIALVLKRTIVNYAGAGSWDAAAKLLSEDGELADVPIEAVVTISKATLVHFAKALQ